MEGKLQQRKKKVGKFLDVGRAGILRSYIREFRFQSPGRKKNNEK
jgi:hypothetical protein